MKSEKRAWVGIKFLAALICCMLGTGCERTVERTGRLAQQPAKTPSLSIVLAPHTGESPIDQEIARRQQEIRDSRNAELALEQLGWAFVAKARESFDAGFYKLAEQCALCLEQRRPRDHGAMLLRGHALQNLHQFKQAEAVARRLVAERGSPFDFALLGDTLMEQGRLGDAIEAYQRMVDLRPDSQAHTRIAHVRWLKGDVEGAIESMQTAAGATSARNAEFAAWVFTRLAGYQFQTGAFAEAQQSCESALQYQRDYPPALLLRGRMLMANGESSKAAELLARSAAANPLPEYQWAWADALREAGRSDEANSIEANLRQHGAAADPRSFALFLATRGESPEVAVRLAERELESRRDVFTFDAMAWSLAAAGKSSEAQEHIERALAEGTVDARLFFHAAIISARNGRDADARQWFQKADRLRHLLLPSERVRLEAARAQLDTDTPTPVGAASAGFASETLATR